jgi:23S rRNA (pseudouridine1915-N3)-methyltransferase
MKLRLLYIQSSRDSWFIEATETYTKKISGFCPFEFKSIKAADRDRDDSAEKKRLESEALLKAISSKDFVILFDEAGRAFENSKAFSDGMRKGQESGRQSVTFLIGGAFGTTPELKQRADAVWSLSNLTMNHMLATVVAMEQIYRALTIQNRIPYHN